MRDGMKCAYACGCAQMLCWTNTLGIQIFAPLTVLGMALCAPAPESLGLADTSRHSVVCMSCFDTHMGIQPEHHCQAVLLAS